MWYLEDPQKKKDGGLTHGIENLDSHRSAFVYCRSVGLASLKDEEIALDQEQMIAGGR